VSFIYPAYASFKAIDSPDQNDDTQWLTYWVVFSFVTLMESILSFVIQWIPFYFFIKVAFFVWLYHPHFLGAGLVYSQILRPHIVPYLKSFAEDGQTVQKKSQ